MAERQVQRGVWVELVTEEITLPTGATTTVDIIRHPGAAAIVPFVTDDRVLLIRQYRYAAGGVIWEIPAGTLEPGESPERCAARELEEEAGQRAGRLVHLGSILTTPGFTDEVIHLYAAFDLIASAQSLDPDELIELVEMPLRDALELVWSGELRDAKSGLALIHAARRLGHLP